MGNISDALSLILDGWENVMTGLGRRARDKAAYASIHWHRMSEVEADELYAGSDLCRKIVDELPEEGFRKGYDLAFKDLEIDASKDLARETADFLKPFDFNARVVEAWKNGRQYGGGAIISVTDDVQDMAKPLNMDNIREVHNFLAVSRWELVYESIVTDLRSVDFGRPEMYMVMPRGGYGEGVQTMRVHASRVVPFQGVHLPRRMYMNNAFWNDSVLNAARVPIRNLEMSLAGVATALQDYSVATYKMKGLAAILDSDEGRDDVTKRMATIDMCRSIARAVVIDSEEEDFTYQNRAMSGVDTIIDKLSGRAVAAADHLPHTKFFGEGPEGFGKNGESEKGDWYDYVASQQANYLRPKLHRLYEILFASRKGPTGGKMPTNFDFTFHPLQQESPGDKAKSRLADAQADQIRIDTQVLDPQEVRSSRFGSGEYSTEIQIDDKFDKKLQDEATLRLEAATTPPTAQPDDQEEGDGDKASDPGQQE